MKKLLYLLFFLLILVVLAVLGRSFAQLQQHKATKVREGKGIDRLFYLNIRGQKTGILARGKNLANPMLLMVHGGPGYPDMMLARCYDEALLDEFTVIRYDQRGIGKSRAENMNLDNLSIEMLTQDLLALADALKAQIPGVDVYLLGHSWGTVLGLKAAQIAPDKFKAYIGMGQIVHQQKGDSISYAYSLEKAKEAHAQADVETLSEMKANSYSRKADQLKLQRNILKKYKGSHVKEGVMTDLRNCVLKSPEMSVLELLSYRREGAEMDEKLFPQLLPLNFFEEIPKLELPVYFFGGRHDYHVPSILAAAYLQQVEAPQKTFIWFEKSGHLPIYEENKKFVSSLKELKVSTP
ncbi:MAG: alpha/beta hydrolase [Bacteroidota bacterium]